MERTCPVTLSPRSKCLLFIVAIALLLITTAWIQEVNVDDLLKLSFLRNKTETDIELIEDSETGFESNEDRQQTLQKMCAKWTRSSNNSLNVILLVVDRWKAIYCAVSKAGSTTMKALLIRAAGHKLTKRQIKGGFGSKGLRPYGIRCLNTYPKKEAEMKLKTYYKYIVVRNPWDRVVSNYRHRFLGKPGDPYRRKLSPIIKKNFRAHGANKTSNIQLGEFIKFIVRTNNPLKLDRHWIPEFYYCDPCTIHYDYIAKVETYTRDIAAIFHKLGIPIRPKLKANSHNDRDNHSLAELYSGIDAKDVDKLYQLYKPDMEAFGYSKPF